MFWVEVLNRALDWRDTESLDADPHAARTVTVLHPKARDALLQDVTLLRWVFASHYVDATPTRAHTDALNQWLAAVTLQVTPSQDAGRTPLLRATRSRPMHPEPFEGLLSSALVQLLGSVQEHTAMSAVHRCHGIERAVAPNTSAPGVHPSDWPQDLEERFARRAGIQRVLTSSLRQCARLVVSERGGRYCSKACSNAAFALRKACDDPRYFAHKQERYRRRKEKTRRGAAAQVDRGAFVYME